MSRCVLGSVVVASVFVLCLDPALAQSLGNLYENKKEGFSLKLPKDFEPIPGSKADEPWLMAQFQGPHLIEYAKAGAIRYPSEGYVFRFSPPRTSSDSELVGANGKVDRNEALRRFGPKSFKEWLTRLAGPKIEKEKEFVLGNLKGKLLEFTITGNGPGQGFQGACVTLPTPDGEFDVAYWVLKQHYDKWSSTFMSSFKSIKFLEREKPSATAGVDPGASEKDKRLTEVLESIKGLKGWYSIPTEHYVILSDTDKDLVKEVGRHLELMRKKYEELFPAKKKIEAVSVVRICKNESDYFKNGGPPGSAGVWKAYEEQLIIYDDTAHNKARTFATMYHEAFHQYIHYACGELSPHDWFNEGTGDFFAGAKLKGNAFEIGKMDWRTETIRNAVRTGDFVPLEKFIHYTHQEYYGPKIEVCYAEGWCFIYFLRNSKNPAWKKIPDVYFATLRDTNDAEKEKGTSENKAGEIAREAALQAAFEGVDLAAMEKAFVEFAKSI